MSQERLLQLETEITGLEDDGWDMDTCPELYELYKEYNHLARKLEDEGRTFSVN